MSDFFSLSTEEQLARFSATAADALSAWSMQGAALSVIKHRENAVFRVDHAGNRAALRIHRYGYHSDRELESELQWMQALSDAGIKVPEIIATDSGKAFAKSAVEGISGSVQVDLFRWIDGSQLGSVEAGVSDESAVEHTFGTLGELAAQVHNQAVSWPLPDGFTRHAWDADGIAGEQPFWGRFWEIEAASDEQRGLLTRVRDQLRDELGQLPKSPGSYSLIHADFAAENIMIDGDEVRLIDFDDAGFGWHLFELVTALYFIRGEPYFARAEQALIDGYRKHRQLTDEDLEMLPLHYLARSTTYVGWVHTRSDTETAKELTAPIVEMACELAEEYLSTH